MDRVLLNDEFKVLRINLTPLQLELKSNETDRHLGGYKIFRTSKSLFNRGIR